MENLSSETHAVIEQGLSIESKNKIQVIPVNQEDFISAFRISEMIKEELSGAVIVEVSLSDKSLNSNLRHANKEGVLIVILLDNTRWGSDVIIKNMKEDRLQSQIPQHLIMPKIKEWLGISSVQEILLGYKTGNIKINTAEFLLDMYYKKGII